MQAGEAALEAPVAVEAYKAYLEAHSLKGEPDNNKNVISNDIANNFNRILILIFFENVPEIIYLIYLYI